MKWPFVPRSLYEVAVAQRDMARSDEKMRESIAIARQMESSDALAYERARYADLLEKYHALAMPKPVTVVGSDGPLAIERSEPSEITKVIREQSQTADGHTDHALARHLRGYAKQLQRQGKSDDEIVGLLVKWQSSEQDGFSSEQVA